MAVHENVINDHGFYFATLLDRPAERISPANLPVLLARHIRDGLRYPVTFSTLANPTVPDAVGWSSGVGTRILDHVFLFEEEMHRTWAYDILTMYQSYGAFYFGIEQHYVGGMVHETNLWTKYYSPEELAAWLRLFWNRKEVPGLESRNIASFPTLGWI